MADYTDGKLKSPKQSKHWHFCPRCHSKWLCITKDRKDCPRPDGIYCVDCNEKTFQEPQNEAIGTSAKI